MDEDRREEPRGRRVRFPYSLSTVHSRCSTDPKAAATTLATTSTSPVLALASRTVTSKTSLASTVACVSALYLRNRSAERGAQIQKAAVMKDPHTGEARGFAFVTMESAEEADAAMTGLNATELLGRVMTVAKARRGRARTRASTSLRDFRRWPTLSHSHSGSVPRPAQARRADISIVSRPYLLLLILRLTCSQRWRPRWRSRLRRSPLRRPTRRRLRRPARLSFLLLQLVRSWLMHRRGGYSDRRGGYDSRGYDDRYRASTVPQQEGGSSQDPSRRGGYDDRRDCESSALHQLILALRRIDIAYTARPDRRDDYARSYAQPMRGDDRSYDRRY